MAAWVENVDRYTSDMLQKCPQCANDIRYFVYALLTADSLVEKGLESAGFTKYHIEDEVLSFKRLRRYYRYEICDGTCFVTFWWKKGWVENLDVIC